MSAQGKTTRYAYTADGQRNRKVGPNDFVAFYGTHLEMRNAAGSEQFLTRYIYAGPMLVAKDELGVGKHWYHQDHLSSTLVLSDETGALARKTEYEAFGQELASTGTASNRRGFGSHYRDDESHLLCMGARYYDLCSRTHRSAQVHLPRMTRLLAALLCLLSTPATAEVTIRWLGVAGFTLTSGETTLAHDPFLSRPGMLRTFVRTYVPDETVLGRFFAPESRAPELTRVKLYLVGHSHYDHLGDVPWLAARTRGRVVGSATTSAIARGYGLAPDEAIIAGPGAVLEEGAFEVRVFASRHAKVFFGRVPLEGELTEPPEAPIHANSFVLGDARGYLVTERESGARIVLLSSAGCDPRALAALGQEFAPVDLLLPAALGRDADYARLLVEALRPRLVVPHHFDDFFTALDDPDAGAPSDEDDLAAFEQELRDAAKAEGIPLEIRRPKLFEALSLPARSADPPR